MDKFFSIFYQVILELLVLMIFLSYRVALPVFPVERSSRPVGVRIVPGLGIGNVLEMIIPLLVIGWPRDRYRAPLATLIPTPVGSTIPGLTTVMVPAQCLQQLRVILPGMDKPAQLPTLVVRPRRDLTPVEAPVPFPHHLFLQVTGTPALLLRMPAERQIVEP